MELFDAIKKLEIFKKNKKYTKLVESAIEHYQYGELQEFWSTFNKLPTNKQLLSELIDSLKGKSVYSNIKKIMEGRDLNRFEYGKSVSSLITHVFIECETKPEYELLLEDLNSKLQTIIYS